MFVADPKDIIKRWGQGTPRLYNNTKAIADRCDVDIKLGNYLIPKFPVPKGETEKNISQLLTYQGLLSATLPV